MWGGIPARSWFQALPHQTVMIEASSRYPAAVLVFITRRPLSDRASRHFPGVKSGKNLDLNNLMRPTAITIVI